MKAIVQDRYGSADVLELRDIDKPLVGDEDVLVRVQSAGVDQGVWHIMADLPYLIRIAGYALRAPETVVPGYDVAGRVEARGGDRARLVCARKVRQRLLGNYAEPDITQP